jgi:hypothetical protein
METTESVLGKEQLPELTSDESDSSIAYTHKQGDRS